MRPLAFAARLRRQSRLLALAPLLAAGALGGCIAGEPIGSSGTAAIPGRYVLSMFSSGVEEEPLPVLVYRTADGLPVMLRYATLDMYDDGTYVEIYELDVMDAGQHEVLETRWDVGNGTWTSSGRDVSFKATLRPGILAGTAFTGYVGDSGGPYAFNIKRTVTPALDMHYRRY